MDKYMLLSPPLSNMYFLFKASVTVLFAGPNSTIY